MYDSYITLDDEELFLCKTNLINLKWVSRDKISTDQYNTFTNKDPDNLDCNTDKEAVYSCTIKCKTRGIILAASNCGIILSFREIYGSESLSQVGLFYLDLLDNFKGI